MKKYFDVIESVASGGCGSGGRVVTRLAISPPQYLTVGTSTAVSSRYCLERSASDARHRHICK